MREKYMKETLTLNEKCAYNCPESRVPSHVLVSIIIPAYNTAQFIHRAIESSLRQTHINIEIIIIDDGSEDDTLETSQKYAEQDSRVKVFHQLHGGVSSARNHGIDEARGEYLFFLDSDDWLEDDTLEFLLEEQAKNPDKVITGEFCYISYDKKRRGIFCRRYQHLTNRTKIFTLEDSVYSLSSLGFAKTVAIKLFRTDIVNKYNLRFRETITRGEDQLFMFEYVCRCGGIVFLKKSLGNILLRPGSLTHTPIAQIIEESKGKTNPTVLMLNSSALMSCPPEIRLAAKVYLCRSILESIRTYYYNDISYEVIKKSQDEAKGYQHIYLSSPRVSRKEKFLFIYRIYAPILCLKFIAHIKSIVKSTLKRSDFIVRMYDAIRGRNFEIIPQ